MKARSSLTGPCRHLCLKVAVLLLSSVSQLWALDPGKAFTQYLQRHWNYQSGLPQKTINAIAQTSDGFLWLATEEGLVRYDGRTFLTYDERNTPVLGDRLIRSLAATSDGGLWIGTMTGLVRYQNGRYVSYREDTRWHQDIYDLLATPDGSVWFSDAKGLHQFVPKTDHSPGWSRIYTTADGLPSDAITGLANAPGGGLWIGTRAGLARYYRGQISPCAEGGSPASERREVITLAGGAGRDVWSGNADGSIDHWNGNHMEVAWQGASTRGHSVVNMIQDTDGSLWVAFRKLGIGRLRHGRLELFGRANGLPSIDPDWIFEDRERNLWVGWADAGLSMFRDGKFTLFGRTEGLPSDVVASVVESRDGSLLVGTEDAGLARLTASPAAAITPVSGYGKAGVMALLEQANGTLWVGSDQGSVTRIIAGRPATFRVPGTLTPGLPAIVEDASGDLWFGFDMPNGLARLHAGRFEFQHLPGHVKALAMAPDGALWIASYLGGLIHYKDGQLRTYLPADGLSNLSLTSVYVDPAGVVWAGTYLGGLNRLKDGRITHYSLDQGLSDSTVGAIIADDYGYLWLAGTRGIMRIKMRELSDYADGLIARVNTQTFGYAAGLRSDECNFKAHPAVLRDRRGRLWFATLSGLAMIDPGKIRADPPVAPALIEGVFAGKRAVPQGSSGFRIHPGETNLSIRFTAPSFVAPQQMQLRYRLASFDDGWSQGEISRSATYAHLSPGAYRFELQVANADGVFSDTTTAIPLEVLPHYYEAWWFHLITAVVLMIMVWLGFRLRTTYLRGKNKRLEKLIVEKTAQVRSALSEAESARDSLRDQANRDFLTGMWNRRAIFEILEKEILRCLAEQRPLAILMADIDHFKKINDTLGHQAGDQVIVEVSLRLRGCVRAQDAVGRYGGEEMLILLPDCGFDQSLTRAESLRAAICASPCEGSGFSVPVTCSFGLAHIHPGTSSGEIVGDADAALYLAKRDGRNCVRLHDATISLTQVAGARV